MHVEEFTRLLGMLVIIIFIGAAAWVAAQVVPQVQAVANLPAKIESENARLTSAAELASATTREQIRALPTLTALDVQARQAAIEAERVQSQAAANALVIAAQGQADGARAQGQALVILVLGACALGAAGLVFLSAREAVSARTTRHIIDVAARDGGRLELPNGYAVTFLPARTDVPRLTDAPVVASYVAPQAQASEMRSVE